MTDVPELTDEQLKRAIPARVRKRLIQGRFESGEDIAALRSFVGLTQAEFARAIEISVHTLRNWEQGRRQPEGPAIALLRIAELGELLCGMAQLPLHRRGRVGIVERPEAYRWCSLGFHAQARNKEGFLSLDFGLRAFGTLSDAGRLRAYRRFVYRVGSLPSGKGAGISEEVL